MIHRQPRKDEECFVVAVRAKASVTVVLGTCFDHVCVNCREPVQLAPSGQRFVATYPQAKIICGQCYFDEPRRYGNEWGLVGSVEEVKAELAAAVPNPLLESN